MRKEKEQSKMGREVSAHQISVGSNRTSSRVQIKTRLGEPDYDERQTLVVKVKRPLRVNLTKEDWYEEKISIGTYFEFLKKKFLSDNKLKVYYYRIMLQLPYRSLAYFEAFLIALKHLEVEEKVKVDKSFINVYERDLLMPNIKGKGVINKKDLGTERDLECLGKDNLQSVEFNSSLNVDQILELWEEVQEELIN